MTHYVLICGSRWYGNLRFYQEKYPNSHDRANAIVMRQTGEFYRRVDKILSDLEGKIVIVSGAAEGPDTLAIRYAKDRGYECEEYPAQWRVNGVYQRNAGIIRNGIMVERATHVIAFWDYQSGGTKNSIRRAQVKGLPLRIIDLRGKQ